MRFVVHPVAIECATIWVAVEAATSYCVILVIAFEVAIVINS